MSAPVERPATLESQALDFIRERGIVRAKELDFMGIPPVILRRLVVKGSLANPGRGVYAIEGMLDDTFANYAIEAVSMPEHGVICLETAAYLHGLTTRNPNVFQVALPPGAWTPKSVTGMPVQCFRSKLIEDPAFDQVPIRLLGREFNVTSVAMTVVDLFRHRGMHSDRDKRVVLEVLANALERGVPSAEIERLAAAARVSTAIGAYLAGAEATINRMG